LLDAETANIYSKVLLLNLNSCEVVLPDIMLLPVLQMSGERYTSTGIIASRELSRDFQRPVSFFQEQKPVRARELQLRRSELSGPRDQARWHGPHSRPSEAAPGDQPVEAAD